MPQYSVYAASRYPGEFLSEQRLCIFPRGWVCAILYDILRLTGVSWPGLDLCNNKFISMKFYLNNFFLLIKIFNLLMWWKVMNVSLIIGKIGILYILNVSGLCPEGILSWGDFVLDSPDTSSLYTVHCTHISKDYVCKRVYPWLMSITR